MTDEQEHETESERDLQDKESPNRLFRVLRLVSLLSSGEPVAMQTISDTFDVSSRTIARDLRFLREFGFAVRTTRDGYCLEQAALRMPTLTDHEAGALGVIRTYLHNLRALPYSDDGDRALSKILSLIPLAEKKQSRFSRFLSFVKPSNRDVVRESDHLRVMIDLLAAERGCEIELRIDDAGKPIERFRCVPLHIEHAFGGWQIYAWSETENRMVAFPVSRIEKLGRTCAPRQVTTVWSYRDQLIHPSHRARASNAYRVLLRLNPISHMPPPPTNWHPAQQVEDLGDDGTRVSFQSVITEHLVQELLRCGPTIEVLEPIFLRKHIGRVAQKMLAHYQSSLTDDKNGFGSVFRFRTAVRGLRAVRISRVQAS